MTDQWKPIGDKWPQPAMVMVETDGSGWARIIGTGYVISISHLRPMPPTITPEQQAVLDAAVRHARRFEVRAPVGDTERDLIDAVDAMLAVQQPPDPVKELLEAAQQMMRTQDISPRLRAAITALEAKS